MEDQIARGVAMCRASCAYFPFGGGGGGVAPANKYFENGTFASTETLFCRLHKKVCLDVTLAFLESRAKAASAGGGQRSVRWNARAGRARGLAYTLAPDTPCGV